MGLGTALSCARVNGVCPMSKPESEKYTEPTFLRQTLAHKKLHALEFILSTVLFCLFVEMVTVFQYNAVVLSVSMCFGFLTTLFFIEQEYDRNHRLFEFKKNSGGTWVHWLRIDGRNYGRYTSTQVRQAELEILTDFGYIIHLFFSKAWWVYGKLLQYVGIVMLTVGVMLAYTWKMHPAMVHSDVLSWIHTGNISSITLLFRHWISCGMMVAFVFLWPSTFMPRESMGETLLRKRVAEQLQDQRRAKVGNMAYQESVNIRARYTPEKLNTYELAIISKQDNLTLTQNHHEVLEKTQKTGMCSSV